MNTSSFTDINDAVVSSGQMVLANVMNFLPALLVALIFLVIGLFLASLLGGLVTKIVRSLRVDKLLDTGGFGDRLQSMDIKFTLSGAFGWLVKWFIIVIVLLTVSSILHLDAVSEFLTQVLLYIPNVLVAMIIVVIGLVVANFVSELVEASMKMSDFISPASVETLRAVTKGIIIFFAVIAALSQLQIAPTLINIFFGGVILMFALAGGLAFGLAGKDKAREFIDRLFKDRQ